MNTRTRPRFSTVAGYHGAGPAWDWTPLPGAVVPARGVVTLRARTDHELAWSLRAAARRTIHARRHQPGR